WQILERGIDVCPERRELVGRRPVDPLDQLRCVGLSTHAVEAKLIHIAARGYHNSVFELPLVGEHLHQYRSLRIDAPLRENVAQPRKQFLITAAQAAGELGNPIAHERSALRSPSWRGRCRRSLDATPRIHALPS